MKLDELEQEMKVVKLPAPRLVKGNQTKQTGFVPSGGPAVLEGEFLEWDGPIDAPVDDKPAFPFHCSKCEQDIESAYCKVCKSTLTVSEIEEEEWDDASYANHLIEKTNDLLTYLINMVTVIQPQDYIEMTNQVKENQVWLEAVAEDEADEETDPTTLACTQCMFSIAFSTGVKHCPDCTNNPELIDENELNDPDITDVPTMNKGNCENMTHSSCVMAIASAKNWCEPCRTWYADFNYNGKRDGVLADDGDMDPAALERLNVIVGGSGLDI